MTSDTEKCAHGERLLAVASVPGSAKLMNSDLKSRNSKVKTNPCWGFSGGSNPSYSALVATFFAHNFGKQGAPNDGFLLHTLKNHFWLSRVLLDL